MLKMINMSTLSSDLERFHNDYNEIEIFLKKHKLDGLELIQYDTRVASMIPPKLIKGLHMSFWPYWLDFWRMDLHELNKQFGNASICRQYYGGESPTVLVEYYRNEIESAIKMKADYVVFHVSNVRPEHCYNYRFTYNDREVVEASIQLINEVLNGVEAHFDVLFENLWWPGLTLLDRETAVMLIEGIKYPYKGFMLDIGHLMNTNINLEDENQAVEYIVDVLEQLGEVSDYIEGIHLNSSLSGEYVKSVINSTCSHRYERINDFAQYDELCRHIMNIDHHLPFISPSINKLISIVNPQYLVYEMLTDSIATLEKYVQIQNNVLDLKWE